MMNWILIVMATMVMVAVAIAIAGLMIPVRSEASVVRRMPFARDKVWNLIRDTGRIHDWCPSLPAIEVIDEVVGESLRLNLRNDSRELVGEWIVSFEADDGGTSVSITMLSLTPNPITRFVHSMSDRTAAAGDFLQRAAGELAH